MHEMIKAALFTPTAKGWGLPLLFWGEPGVSKSDIIESVAEAHEMYCLVLSPGERGEGAFGVTPMPKEVNDTIYMSYPSPEWVLDIERSDGRAVVFVDEINTAMGSVKPALLGLIQARRMGGEYLGHLVRVLGAANPPEVATEGTDLPPATANRLGHIMWVPPKFDDWNEWMMNVPPIVQQNAHKRGNQKRAEAEEARVLAEWPGAFSWARALTTSYLGAKQSMLHKMPGAADPNLTKAWPSRRTWYLATCAIASAVVHELDGDARNTLLQGFVGEAAMKELIKHEAEARLPRPEAVLDGTSNFRPDATRLDITRAVLNSCAGILVNPKAEKRESRMRNFWSLLGLVIDEGTPDIAVLAARMIAKSQPFKDGKRPVDMTEAKGPLKAIRPTMEAAGYHV